MYLCSLIEQSFITAVQAAKCTPITVTKCMVCTLLRNVLEMTWMGLIKGRTIAIIIIKFQ
jgi:hypothetical protein